MASYLPNTFGERIAGIYDELYADYDPAAITALSQLAQGELARPGPAHTELARPGPARTSVEVHRVTSWLVSPFAVTAPLG